MEQLIVPYFKQDTTYTCGPTCLQMVLAYYGMNFSEASLARRLATEPERGTSHQHLITLAQAMGLYVYVNNEATIEGLWRFVKEKKPPIIHWIEPSDEDDHYSVVVGINDDWVVMHDPWHGEAFRMTRKDFESRWQCGPDFTCKQWFMIVSPEEIAHGRQYAPQKVKSN